MKLFAALMFAPILAFAAKNAHPEFKCETELPSTTFEAVSTKSSVQLKVDHHFGLDSIPVQIGVVTANDFPYLQAKAEVLKKLGESFQVEFKPENCESFGEHLYSCFSRDTIRINGAEIHGYSFLTRVVTSKVYQYSFKTTQMVFSFIYQSMNYDLPMAYGPGECAFK
jgi:hypothetical protein